MLIGYARVSTHDQNEALQIDALKKVGCEKIFLDKASGAKEDRPELAKALDYTRTDDVLVVWRLDRLGRSLKHLIEVVNGLEDKGSGFQSLNEGFDTTTNGGRLVFNMFGALAEFERGLIQERTKAGLDSARARGRMGGRRSTITPKQIARVDTLLDADPDLLVKDACKQIGISRQSYYRLKQDAKAKGKVKDSKKP